LQTEHHRSGYSLRTGALTPESPVRMRASMYIENAIFRSERHASEGMLIGFDCSQLATA
jgi:hypothetical protein